jgi:pectin methylesterase-like acyl-CoA thioesterase/polygalacturonase
MSRPTLGRLTPGLAALCAAAGLLTPVAYAADTPSVTIKVSQGGDADYTTIQAAVNAVPDNSATPYVISIQPGIYTERLTIPAGKLHLSLEGADHDPRDVKITSADYNQETNPLTGAAYGTEGSATTHVKANDFTAEYISFENTFDKTRHPEVTGTQAVAIAMEGDRQVYKHDVFYGHQDTLLTWNSTATTTLRQYVYDSEIAGDVDFIFGNGTLVVDRSTINALNDGIYSKAYLTAPSTFGTNPYGIMITGSVVNTTLATNNLYLGRAWRPNTAADPQAIFQNTLLPQATNAAPWLGISGATWTAGRYGEYADYGPGASTTSAADRPLYDDTAGSVPRQTFLAGSDGWNPVEAGTGWNSATGGDRRDVARPLIPDTCQTVTAAMPTPPGRVFADAQEAAPPDTSRIQAALDACANSGKAVVLATDGGDDAFLSAPLTVHAGEWLVLGTRAKLYATRVAAQYQIAGKDPCGDIDGSGTGCTPFITVSGRDAGIASFQQKSHQGTVDGRADLPMWGTTTTFWDQAVTAKAEGLKQIVPRLIQSFGSDDFTAYDIDLVNSAKMHLFVQQSIGFTAWGVRILTPTETLNTDGINIDSSTDASVTHSYIANGDDCIAMGAGKAALEAVTITDVHCYGSHGISIGSGTTYGVDDVFVNRDTIQGTGVTGVPSTLNNGIRVKSFIGSGGLVTNVTYARTCMSGVQYLIDLDPNYSYGTPGTANIPWFKSITIRDTVAVHSTADATSVLDGYDADHPLGLTLRNVQLDNTTVTSKYAAISIDRSNLAPTGDDVTVTSSGHTEGKPIRCDFPPYPPR